MASVLCVSHEWNLGFEELRALANGGFRVVSAPNGHEAIRHFATKAIDAVIVNRRLPDIEVADLVSYFRNHDEGIPIVMLSAVMPPESVPAKVDAVVHKYSSAALLVPTLELLLASRSAKQAERSPLPKAA